MAAKECDLRGGEVWLVLRSLRACEGAKYGQEWIRTTEGVKPADLQDVSTLGEFGLAGKKRAKTEPSSTSRCFFSNQRRDADCQTSLLTGTGAE
jgi:hypothetical protein